MEEIWDLQSTLIEKHAQRERECAVAMTFFRCVGIQDVLVSENTFCFFTRLKSYLGQSGGAFYYFCERS